MPKQKINYSDINDGFKVMFENAIKEIASRYSVGTLEYVKEHESALYERIQQALNEVDRTWVAGRVGDATAVQFREIVERYYLLNIEAIKVYQDFCNS